MRFENTHTYGMGPAIEGMRNAKESWNKADSYYETPGVESSFVLGPNDMNLARRLIKSGPEHRKFMRQIFVSVDITAPIYWWKEFDTYKVSTVRNSTSTMHKLATTPITIDCFETDDYQPDFALSDNGVEDLVKRLEDLRKEHLRAMDSANRTDITSAEQKHFRRKAKYYWKELIRWLPESWLQKSKITMNYENLLAMCSKGQRRFHKLNEWSGKEQSASPHFIAWARTLPYAQELLFGDELLEAEKNSDVESINKSLSEIGKKYADCSEDNNKIVSLQEEVAAYLKSRHIEHIIIDRRYAGSSELQVIYCMTFPLTDTNLYMYRIPYTCGKEHDSILENSVKPETSTSSIENIAITAMEECGEITQAISKCLRFGPDGYYKDPNATNGFLVMKEFYHLLAMVEELQEREYLPKLPPSIVDLITSDKLENVMKFQKLSEERGLMKKD